MMGLFPEIGRAWLTIDSDIYVIRNVINYCQGYNCFVFGRFGRTRTLEMLPIMMVSTI